MTAMERYTRTPAMLHSINAKGILEAVSDQWLEKFGYTREEVLGRPSTDFLTEESRRYAREVVLPEFFKTGSCDVIYDMVHKDGHVFPVRLRATATRNPDGTFAQSNAVLEDLTEQRALEKKMMQAQKLESLGLMAGTIAHDFNNLLVTVIGNAQLALDEAHGQQQLMLSLTNILTASRRATELCRQLLAYSGRGRFTVEEVNLSDLVREMAQVLEVSVGRDVVMKLDLASPGPRALVDATQVRQVVMNLVLNAVEALEGKRGLVTVVTSLRFLDEQAISRSTHPEVRPGEFVCIEVGDTGPGIDAENLERVFDPFFTTKATGRGLGLAAVHGIVRGHHGTMKLESTPGRGTRFKVYLPACPSAAPETVPAKATRGVVLIVDDDEGVRQTLSRQMTHVGYQALEARDAEEAMLLARARGAEVSCFLVDVSLPGMSGPQLVKELQTQLPQAVVLLMSGYNNEEVVETFGAVRLAGFLQKPFPMESFLKIMEKSGIPR